MSQRVEDHLICSYACAIELEDRVILTGGVSRAKVHVYNQEGYVMDLPDLVQGRQAHACGYFVNDAGHRVHLVTGGYSDDFLSSTEILYNGDPAWTTAGLGHLPAPANGLRGVSIDNNILVTGN